MSNSNNRKSGLNPDHHSIPVLKMEIERLEDLSAQVPHVKLISVAELQTLTLVVTRCNKPISKILSLGAQQK